MACKKIRCRDIGRWTPKIKAIQINVLELVQSPDAIVSR
jgi:hypothetical protein